MDIVEATTAANAWLDHARPIIRAYLAMEDACLAADICTVHYGKDDASKAKTRDYREADGYRKEAQRSLYDMMEGIRDNYLADQCPPMPDDDDEAAWDARDAFNDELARSVISVDAAVRMVEGEL